MVLSNVIVYVTIPRRSFVFGQSRALLLCFLSFPHLWCPCLGFNLSLISNTIIYYPEKGNQNNSCLRTKIPRRLLPPCFSEYFEFTSSVHSCSTRQSCNRSFYVTLVNTTQYGLRYLKFTGPRLWNSLPTSITNSNSLRIFRKTLKNSILNCYSN